MLTMSFQCFLLRACCIVKVTVVFLHRKNLTIKFCLLCFFLQRRKHSVSRRFDTYLTHFFFLLTPITPNLLISTPQSPVHWCPAWSFSAWSSFWAFLPPFGSSTTEETRACLPSRRSSTTLLSGSWIRISPAWWRPRRLTARPRTG